jgi:hypothetical protein
MSEQQPLRSAYWLTSEQKAQLARQSKLPDPYKELMVMKPEYVSSREWQAQGKGFHISSHRQDYLKRRSSKPEDHK